MSPKLTLLALLLASLSTSLPVHRASQENATYPLNSSAPNVPAHALAKRTTANLPFDGFEYNKNHQRSDGEREGDVFRLSKCYCIDTPSRDLPAAYGQYYGNYYGFDYYNYHHNKSYAFSWTCRSGELETLNGAWTSAESYYLAPQCLSWMEEERKECWDTGDGNEFCAEVYKGKDFYYWNGQKRRVWNHPPAGNTTAIQQPLLNDECQRMCQTVPANTKGYMQDVVPSDREHKLNLATATACSAETGVSISLVCDYPWEKPHHMIPKVWETFNYIETYTEEADMCKGCA